MTEKQNQFCIRKGLPCEITNEDDIVGFALDTQGKTPINGLRHPHGTDSSGWYIWCGEEYSSDANFFSPLHVRHLVNRCPEVIEFLGLPPGYRFLYAEGFLDIWLDDSLLNLA